MYTASGILQLMALILYATSVKLLQATIKECCKKKGDSRRTTK